MHKLMRVCVCKCRCIIYIPSFDKQKLGGFMFQIVETKRPLVLRVHHETTALKVSLDVFPWTCRWGEVFFSFQFSSLHESASKNICNMRIVTSKSVTGWWYRVHRDCSKLSMNMILVHGSTNRRIFSDSNRSSQYEEDEEM